MKDMSAWWLRGVVAALLLAVGAWALNNTEWVEVDEPLPLAEELRQDGTLVARRLLERLGARTRVVHTLETLPTAGATLVLAAPFWDLSLPSQDTLHQWVLAGGHLVVDQSMLDDPPQGGWLPQRRATEDRKALQVQRDDPCRVLKGPEGQPVAWGDERGFVGCMLRQTPLLQHPAAIWQLTNDEGGIEVQRVPVGQGRITAFAPGFRFDWQMPRVAAIAGGPIRLRNFSNRGLLEGDNAALLAAVVDVRPGRDIWFMTQVNRPPLPLWLWQEAAPALCVGLLALALALWRSGLRFGPLAVEPPARRRSLSAQIAGLADFLFSRRSNALHAAAARALREAAHAHVPGWQALKPAARTLALARATGLPADALERAQEATVLRDGPALSDTLALLETARRRMLAQRRAQHPTPRPAAAPSPHRTQPHE